MLINQWKDKFPTTLINILKFDIQYHSFMNEIEIKFQLIIAGYGVMCEWNNKK